MNLAKYHESEIEKLCLDLMQKKCKDCSVNYYLDGEDCFIDITKSLVDDEPTWSFDINFGVGKFYVLKPRTRDVYDFESINELFDIIKSYL